MMRKFIASSVTGLALLITPQVLTAGPLDDLEKAVRIIDGLNRLGKQPPKGGNQPKASPQRPSQSSQQAQASRAEWKKVQGRLNELGFNAGSVDGRPGLQTKNAVVAFQRANGLQADGKVGPRTRSVLFSASARANVPTIRTVAPATGGGGSLAVATSQPSFDCSANLNPVEQAVCGSSILSGLDAQLNTVFAAAVQNDPGIRASQRTWVAERDACGSSLACIEQAYKARIAVLSPTTASPPSAVVTVGLPVNQQTPLDVMNAQGQVSYYGEISCGRKSHKFQLTLKSNGPGQFIGEMDHFFRWSMSGRHESGTFVGEFDSNKNSLSIVRSGRRQQGISWLGSKIIDIENAKNPKFTIRNSDCKLGTLSQFDPARSPVGVIGAGTFSQAQTMRDKCEAILGWLEKQDQIYDPKVVAGSRNYAKMFVDDLFVPVFGVSYDRIGTEELARRFSQARNNSELQCRREPFLKDRWQKVTLIYDEGFTYAEGRRVYIDWYVRKSRTIQSDAVAALQNAPDIYKVNALSDVIPKSDIEEFLTKEKVRELEALLTQLKNNRAQSEMTAFVREFNAMQAEPKALHLLSAQDSKPSFHKWLSQTSKSEFDGAIKTAFASSVDELLQPVLLEAQFAPEGLEGIEVVNDLMRQSVLPKLKTHGSDLAVVRALQREVSVRQEAVVQDFQNRLSALPSGIEGLDQGIFWIEDLNGAARRLLPEKSVAQLTDLWDKSRDAILEAAIGQFEQTLQSAQPDQVEQIVAQFINKKYDSSRPIALEYEFVALSYQ